MKKGHEKNLEKLLGVIEMLSTLIVVVVLQMYTLSETHPVVHFNACNFLYINYTSIELFLKIASGGIPWWSSG